MTSTLDNCIFLNAFSKDQNLFNDSSIYYLLNLHEFNLPWLNEYYARSERIVCKIKELNLDNTETWTDNMRKGAEYYKNNYGWIPIHTPDTPLDKVLLKLKEIYKCK